MTLDPISVALGAAVALSCSWLWGEFRARWAAQREVRREQRSSIDRAFDNVERSLRTVLEREDPE